MIKAQGAITTVSNAARNAAGMVSSMMRTVSLAMRDLNDKIEEGEGQTAYAIRGVNETRDVITGLQKQITSLKTSLSIQSCGELGTQDGDLRFYTEEECDALNGTFNSTGECFRKEGGSFTYDCGLLYKDKPPSQSAMAKREAAENALIKNAAARNAAARSAAYGEATTTKRATTKKSTTAAVAYGQPDPPKAATEKVSLANVPSETIRAVEQIIERVPEIVPRVSNAAATVGTQARNMNAPAIIASTTDMDMLLKDETAALAADAAAYKIAESLGLRAKLGPGMRGYSLPIGSSLGDFSHSQVAADRAFFHALIARNTPNEASAKAASAAEAAEKEFRTDEKAKNLAMNLAKEMGLGANPRSPAGAPGYSLPMGSYSLGVMQAADKAFEYAISIGEPPLAAANAAAAAAAAALPPSRIMAATGPVSYIPMAATGPVSYNPMAAALAASGALAAAQSFGRLGFGGARTRSNRRGRKGKQSRRRK